MWNAKRIDMNTSEYIPHLPCGTQIRFVGLDRHSRNGPLCVIIRILPNPSKRAEHQWYDVRFEDGSIACLLEKRLEPANNKVIAA
jgi:hypothetical protein